MINMSKLILKLTSVFCVLAMALGGLALAEGDAMRVVALKGPTAMGLVKLMEVDKESGSYSFDIIAAVDENDHMFMRIAGTGMESQDKLSQFSSFFAENSKIISDDRSSIINFAKDSHMKSDVIPSLGAKKRYKTDKGNSLSSVNQLHQEIEILKYRKRGVSTRHLQGYLNWIIFRKKIRYHFEARNRKPEAYMKMMGLEKTLISTDICKIDMPIDLYRVYGEYHYGIFSNRNPYPEGVYNENGLLSTYCGMNI